MAEFVGPALEVGKCIAEPIKRQLNYLCCFNTNIQNLKDEAKKLGEAKEGVEGRVDAERNNAQVILREVETWLHNVNTIQSDMRGIETDEIPNVKSGCLGIKSRFLLSRKATKMAAAIKELQNDRGKFGQICHRPPPPAMASSIPVGQIFELETRKHLEDQIMATLREKKVNMMGICGMGGVGKTTMAKNMAKLLGLKLEVESIEDASLAAQQINLPNLVEFTIDFVPVSFTLRLKGREMRLNLKRHDIGDWIDQLVRTTEILELRREGSSKLVPLLPKSQSLTELTILKKAKMARLSDGRSSGPTTTVFPLLEVLRLHNIDDLEEIQRGPISSHSYKNLSSIEIVYCHSLRSLFPWGMGNDSLLRLKSLTVKYCSKLEVMWDEEDGKEIGQSSRNHCHTTFPNLKEVFLDDLPSINSDEDQEMPKPEEPCF